MWIPPKKKKKKPFVLRMVKWLFIIFFFIIFSGALVGVGGYIYFSKGLPDLSKIENYRAWIPVVSEIFDAHGNKIGEFVGEGEEEGKITVQRRILVPYEEIPKNFIHALVAAEDQRFFKHPGWDWRSNIRALLAVVKRGERIQGASTLTQQLIRNILLTKDRKLGRKIKETMLAIQIESHLKKEEILYLYLNHMYLGNGSYGIASAAENYFRKSLKDLDVAEIAVLVSFLKYPGDNPADHPKDRPAYIQKIKGRQAYVLNRMKEDGYLTDEQVEEAKKFPLKMYNAWSNRDYNRHFAPYFVDDVWRYLSDKAAVDPKYQNFKSKGWKIYTTIDLKMDQEAALAVNRGVREFDKRQGFRGPLEHLDDDLAIREKTNKTHFEIWRQAGGIDIWNYPTEESQLSLETPLREDEYYDAVVLGGTAASGLEVQVGNKKGILAQETTRWAGAAASKLRKGDVIQVKLYKKPLPNPNANRRGAAASPTSEPILSESEKIFFALEQQPLLEGALYSYEPESGAVRAVSGGLDHRKNEVNIATQALRQPGSAIKPLIYAAAIEKGYTPDTIVMDAPFILKQPGGKDWVPKNAGGGFSGAIPLKLALAKSINLVAVRVTMDIGLHYLTAFMRKAGLTTDILKVPSMALGANAVKLSDLARAYGMFPAGGILPDTFFVEKIVDSSGNVIESHPNRSKNWIVKWAEKGGRGRNGAGAESLPHRGPSVLDWNSIGFRSDLFAGGELAIEKDGLNLKEAEKKILYGEQLPPDHIITPRTAVSMVSMMEGVVKFGTATRVLALEKPAAGKTGTTNRSTDVWFMGYTPNLVAGVWVGYPKEAKSIGHSASGGEVSAPIWLYYMQKATENYPTLDFKLAQGVDLGKYPSPKEIPQIENDVDLPPEYEENEFNPKSGESSGGGADIWTDL